jgi:hypothetical protein
MAPFVGRLCEESQTYFRTKSALGLRKGGPIKRKRHGQLKLTMPLQNFTSGV